MAEDALLKSYIDCHAHLSAKEFNDVSHPEVWKI